MNSKRTTKLNRNNSSSRGRSRRNSPHTNYTNSLKSTATARRTNATRRRNGSNQNDGEEPKRRDWGRCKFALSPEYQNFTEVYASDTFLADQQSSTTDLMEGLTIIPNTDQGIVDKKTTDTVAAKSESNTAVSQPKHKSETNIESDIKSKTNAETGREPENNQEPKIEPENNQEPKIEPKSSGSKPKTNGSEQSQSRKGVDKKISSKIFLDAIMRVEHDASKLPCSSAKSDIARLFGVPNPLEPINRNIRLVKKPSTKFLPHVDSDMSLGYHQAFMDSAMALNTFTNDKKIIDNNTTRIPVAMEIPPEICVQTEKNITKTESGAEKDTKPNVANLTLDNNKLCAVVNEEPLERQPSHANTVTKMSSIITASEKISSESTVDDDYWMVEIDWNSSVTTNVTEQADSSTDSGAYSDCVSSMSSASTTPSASFSTNTNHSEPAASGRRAVPPAARININYRISRYFTMPQIRNIPINRGGVRPRATERLLSLWNRTPSNARNGEASETNVSTNTNPSSQESNPFLATVERALSDLNNNPDIDYFSGGDGAHNDLYVLLSAMTEENENEEENEEETEEDNEEEEEDDD